MSSRQLWASNILELHKSQNNPSADDDDGDDDDDDDNDDDDDDDDDDDGDDNDDHDLCQYKRRITWLLSIRPHGGW